MLQDLHVTSLQSLLHPPQVIDKKSTAYNIQYNTNDTRVAVTLQCLGNSKKKKKSVPLEYSRNFYPQIYMQFIYLFNFVLGGHTSRSGYRSHETSLGSYNYFLLPCGSGVPNSGHQAPLPTEPRWLTSWV